MLLALDVGNTHTVLGVYSGSDLIDRWSQHIKHVPPMNSACC